MLNFALKCFYGVIEFQLFACILFHSLIQPFILMLIELILFMHVLSILLQDLYLLGILLLQFLLITCNFSNFISFSFQFPYSS